MSSSPVGFFDSGIGGISLWMIVNEILPNENTIYLSDSKNCPYGNKPTEYLFVDDKGINADLFFNQ